MKKLVLDEEATKRIAGDDYIFKDEEGKQYSISMQILFSLPALPPRPPPSRPPHRVRIKVKA